MSTERNWWRPGRDFTRGEIRADGLVHLIGLAAAVAAGSVFMASTLSRVTPAETGAAAIYVSTLLAVLTVSLAFNMWPISPAKRLLARIDQATIFLFIAGTYTPFLVALSGTSPGQLMLALVWGAALCGVALKLIVPHAFGHFAVLLYVGIGASGIVVF